MSYSKKYTYNNPPVVYINDEMFLNISLYLYMYTYILCVCVCWRAHEHSSPSLALTRQCQGHQVSKSLAAEQRSPLRTKDWLDAPSPVKDQVGGTVAARNARLIARTNLIPVVTGLDTSWAAGVIHSPVLTLGGWKKGGDKGEMWGNGLIGSPTA